MDTAPAASVWFERCRSHASVCMWSAIAERDRNSVNARSRRCAAEAWEAFSHQPPDHVLRGHAGFPIAPRRLVRGGPPQVESADSRIPPGDLC